MSESLTVARAELMKVRALRSLVIALALFAAVSVLVGALDGWSARTALDTDPSLLREDFTPAQAGLDGIQYGQLALIVFGVLLGAGEYTSGMIQASLLAVPHREHLYWVKVFVAAIVAAAVVIPVCVVAYVVTQVGLGEHGVSITAPGAPQALAGASFYLLAMCLFAFGIATAMRQTVLPMAVLLPMVLIVSRVLTLFPVAKDVSLYFPDRAGAELLTIGSDHTLRGIVVLSLWTAAALWTGLVRSRRWDG